MASLLDVKTDEAWREAQIKWTSYRAGWLNGAAMGFMVGCSAVIAVLAFG